MVEIDCRHFKFKIVGSIVLNGHLVMWWYLSFSKCISNVLFLLTYFVLFVPIGT